MAARLTLLLALLLPGCSRLTASAWRESGREQCYADSEQLHQNGYWARDFCRDGTGVLVWAVWEF